VRIERFLHKGLKRLYLEDNAKGLPAEAADKLRKMLSFLEAMNDEDELEASLFGRRTVSQAIARAPGA